MHGRKHEPKAIKSFEKDSHNTVRKCGMFVSLENNFLAASPDGLVAKVSLLEVKCPYSIRNEPVTADNYSHLEYQNGEFHLKKTVIITTRYRLRCTAPKKNFVFFYVWTFCG